MFWLGCRHRRRGPVLPGIRGHRGGAHDCQGGRERRGRAGMAPGKGSGSRRARGCRASRASPQQDAKVGGSDGALVYGSGRRVCGRWVERVRDVATESGAGQCRVLACSVRATAASRGCRSGAVCARRGQRSQQHADNNKGLDRPVMDLAPHGQCKLTAVRLSAGMSDTWARSSTAGTTPFLGGVPQARGPRPVWAMGMAPGASG
jgi:hypothetical protein